MKNLALFLALCTLSAPCAVNAQGGYNASYGGGRVIYGGNGLSTPSGSYIGGANSSPSAKGILQSGPQVNPGIPRVGWGSAIGTPGDNQYGANRINAPAQTVTQRNNAPNLPGSGWGANIGTAGDTMRSDLNPNYYRNNRKFSWPVQQQQQAPQQPSAIQEMINRQGNGPLRYDGGAAHVNY